MRLPLLVFKMTSTPSPMFLPMASDAGIHILVQDISDKQHLKNLNVDSLPDGMQSFPRCTVRIGTVGNKILDSSQAIGITRFKSRELVDNKTVVILWTKREVNVGPSSWRGLVCGHRHIE